MLQGLFQESYTSFLALVRGLFLTFLFLQWRNQILVITTKHINWAGLRIFLSLTQSDHIVWITSYVPLYLPFFFLNWICFSIILYIFFPFASLCPVFLRFFSLICLLTSWEFFSIYLWCSISFFSSYLCLFTHLCVLTFFFFFKFCRTYFYVSAISYYLISKPSCPLLQMKPWSDG